ncbi:hypothetical protein [Desulfovibrio sp. X2]|uniref:hypothetical protein n=1 Tax=Desulfovibrio sp. X2 TaxID=941449 RepID=UPI0012684A96|nr:hypothetical protein [Desulfovibrio sp. X2]
MDLCIGRQVMPRMTYGPDETRKIVIAHDLAPIEKGDANKTLEYEMEMEKMADLDSGLSLRGKNRDAKINHFGVLYFKKIIFVSN